MCKYSAQSRDFRLSPSLAMKAQKTKRELKNKHSGLDMLIPEFVDKRGMLGTGTVMYKVIVVTNLPYFKSDTQSDADVVQFSVERRYTDFEKLQTDLTKEFPLVPFPSLPPKIPNILLTGDALEDRLVSFDSMVKKVAMHAKMSSSNSLLDFLGVSSHKRIEVFRKLKQKKKREADKAKKKKDEEIDEDEEEEIFKDRQRLEEAKKKKSAKSAQVEKWDETNKEDEELFGGKGDGNKVDDKPGEIVEEKKEVDSPLIVRKVTQDDEAKDDEEDELFANLPQPKGGYSVGGLFDSDKPALFDDESSNAADNVDAVQGKSSFEVEDHSDLLKVEDTAEFEAHLAEKVKPKTKPKPALKPKPQSKPQLAPKPQTKPKPASKPALKPKPKPKPKSDEDDLFALAADTSSDAFDGDISKYIETNLRQQTDENLDLFS
ncbi:HCLS1-binding protein 3-like [Oscarella lobularis]|uniref:HCLS1-binding protein 3-like n=1 Tax=Oscarella lobularis TaxID=121494 RepID=UPI003313A22C